MKELATFLFPFLLFFSCSHQQEKPTPSYYFSEKNWWKPRPGMKWQIQFSGKFKEVPEAEVYDLDLFDTPTERIAALHLKGKKVICYFSAGSFEEWREDAKLFKKEHRGAELKEWKGESWLDIRNDEIRSIMRKRMDVAKEKGCDGIDPDNVDGYNNKNQLNLSYKDQLEYNKFLAYEAHKRGMAIGLKNDLNQIKDLVDDYDFSINESCDEYNECDLLKPFIERKKAVFAISYNPLKEHCPKGNELNLDMVVKERKLTREVIYCR